MAHSDLHNTKDLTSEPLTILRNNRPHYFRANRQMKAHDFIKAFSDGWPSNYFNEVVADPKSGELFLVMRRRDWLGYDDKDGTVVLRYTPPQNIVNVATGQHCYHVIGLEYYHHMMGAGLERSSVDTEESANVLEVGQEVTRLIDKMRGNSDGKDT